MNKAKRHLLAALIQFLNLGLNVYRYILDLCHVFTSLRLVSKLIIYYKVCFVNRFLNFFIIIC